MIPAGKPIRVRIENDKPAPKRGLLAALKDVAPLITGIGTLMLSLVSFYYVRVQDRAKGELAADEIRVKALAAVNETDSTKRDVGAMSVAIYGKTAIPVIRFLLSGSSSNPGMRPFGVLVVQHWMDSADAAGRADVLAVLDSCARADSVNLREGAYAAFAGLSGSLSKLEDNQLLALLQERFGGPAGPIETDPGVARLACPLLNKYDYSASRVALRAITRYVPDQALESYTTILVHLCEPQSRQLFGKDLSAASVPDILRKKQSELLTSVQKGCSK